MNHDSILVMLKCPIQFHDMVTFFVDLENWECTSVVPYTGTPSWNFERPYLTGRHVSQVLSQIGCCILQM